MRRPTDGDSSASAGHPLAPYAQPGYPAAAAAGAFGVPTTPLAGGYTLPTFFGLLNALKRRWVLGCFLGLLAGLAAAAGLWLGMPDAKHQVKGLLFVQPLRNPVGRNASEEDYRAFKENQQVLIKTRGLLRTVVNHPRVAQQPLVANSDDPVKMLEELIKVQWAGPDVLAVMLNGNNPEQLRVILDELMKAYTKEAKDNDLKQQEEQRELLTKAQVNVNNEITAIEQRVRRLNNREGVPGGDNALGAMIALHAQQESAVNQRVYDLQQRILTQKEQLRELDARLKRIDAEKISDAAIDAELAKDGPSRALAQELDAAQRNLAELELRLQDGNSPAIAKQRQAVTDLRNRQGVLREQRRADTEKRIRAEARAAAEAERLKLDRERDVNEGLLKRLEEQAEGLAAQRRDLVNKSQLIQRESKDLDLLRERSSRMSSDLLALRMAQQAEDRVKVAEPAQVIFFHNQKQKMVFSAAVAVGAFLAVLTLVAFLEWRSRRVDGVEQVVNEIGLRVIGTIPAFPSRASLKAGEADQNQNWRFILNESVNSARTMLLHTAKSQSMQVIMVTSATQGEGKTSLSSQLATSMATAGLRTLILDCDLRNPSMHRLFDVGLAPGVSEVLLGEVDVSDAVQPTTVPNLWLIPAGQCSNRVVAALAQGHPLDGLFNRLRGQFDFVVVDSCPVLPVADALLIAQHVDGVVISILQDISQLPKVLNASERLTQLNIPLLGAVVNGIRTDVHAYGYNYVKQLPA
jgi:capsular exopolysaccharide synthesis family protein